MSTTELCPGRRSGAHGVDRNVGEPGWKRGQDPGEVRKQSKNLAGTYYSRSPGGAAAREGPGLGCS